MRPLLLAVLLVFSVAPSLAQTSVTLTPELATKAQLADVDTKAQQALDGTTVLGNNQVVIQGDVADLLARVAELEAAAAGATWPAHGIFHLNAVPYGEGNSCNTTVGVAVACPANVSDLEGDDIDALIGCDLGSYDGETFTPDPTDAGGTRTCTVAASDPARPHVIHQSTVTITVEP